MGKGNSISRGVLLLEVEKNPYRCNSKKLYKHHRQKYRAARIAWEANESNERKLKIPKTKRRLK